MLAQSIHSNGLEQGQAGWESSTLPEAHLEAKDLAMEFVGQYNEPFVEWNDVSVVELSST